MRRFLLPLALTGLAWFASTQSQAQQRQSYAGPIWSNETVPINLMPGWPPLTEGRVTRGMFGNRTLGQTLRPRDMPSRFSPGGVVRGASGDFVGIGSKRPAVAQTPPVYVPPYQTPIPTYQAPAPQPVQPQPGPAQPEQPLPRQLQEQLMPEGASQQ